MDLTSTNKRFLFENLIYKLTDDQYLLLNLISFRRQIITKESLTILQIIEQKQKDRIALTQDENKIINELYMNKQLLSQTLINEVESQLEMSSNTVINAENTSR